MTPLQRSKTRVSTSDFDQCMAEAAGLYENIFRDLPIEAQYVVPFAYKIRWYIKMNLREAVHMCELRTMPQGHPDYRFICQEMWRRIQEVHPTLAECGKFIDWKSYRLGRLQSEMRTEFKNDTLKKGKQKEIVKPYYKTPRGSCFAAESEDRVAVIATA